MSGEGESNDEPAATIDHEEVHFDLNAGSWPSESTKEPTPAQNGEPAPRPIVTQPGTITFMNSSEKANINSESPAVLVLQGPPDPKKKPRDFVVTSCIVILLCNFIFGILGWHFGLKSNYAWHLGDEEQAKKRSRHAMIFVILGVIAGVITWVLAFTLFFTLRNGAHPGVENRQT